MTGSGVRAAIAGVAAAGMLGLSAVPAEAAKPRPTELRPIALTVEVTRFATLTTGLTTVVVAARWTSVPHAEYVQATVGYTLDGSGLTFVEVPPNVKSHTFDQLGAFPDGTRLQVSVLACIGRLRDAVCTEDAVTFTV